MEAENLKDKLQAELIQFQEMLTGYLEAKTVQEKALYLIQIKKQLKKSSKFRAFKQQIWALI